MRLGKVEIQFVGLERDVHLHLPVCTLQLREGEAEKGRVAGRFDRRPGRMPLNVAMQQPGIDLRGLHRLAERERALRLHIPDVGRIDPNTRNLQLRFPLRDEERKGEVPK